MFEYVKFCFRKYATFSGRAGRAEYWYFYLFQMLISIPLQFMSSMLENGSSSLTLSVIVLLLSLTSLALFLPSLSVAVRRLHDTNHSGWWMLINLVLIIGNIYFLYLMIKEGDKGENQYGTDPKEVEEI